MPTAKISNAYLRIAFNELVTLTKERIFFTVDSLWLTVYSKETFSRSSVKFNVIYVTSKDDLLMYFRLVKEIFLFVRIE